MKRLELIQEADRQSRSFRQLLQTAAETVRSSGCDPWTMKLERVKGKRGSDGVERLSTVDVFDFLELRRFERTPEAGKRVKAIMSSLGWTAVRGRQVTSSGAVGRVRGYARLAY